MKATTQRLVLAEPGRFAWKDVSAPTLGSERSAIVRPTAVTLCDLDRPVATGAFPLPMPIPFGHEFVGAVVEIGDAVTSVDVGDRVVVPFQISDGECPRCRTGLTANCAAVPPRSQYGFGAVGGNWGGGFSDLVGVPYADAMLLRVPPGVDPLALAAAGDNLVDGLRCVAPFMDRRPDARVLVLGGIGSVPLYAAMFAVGLEASRVDYVDSDTDRRRIAESVGATAHEEIPEPSGAYDVAVDGTLFDPTGLGRAAETLDVDGALTIATIYLTRPELPHFELYMKGVDIRTGRVQARAGGPRAIELVAAGLVDPMLVTAGELLDWEGAADSILDAGVKPIYVRSP